MIFKARSEIFQHRSQACARQGANIVKSDLPEINYPKFLFSSKNRIFAALKTGMANKLRALFNSLRPAFSITKDSAMPAPGAFTLAICSIIKDENDYLAEWINYHLKTGVQHFFIYDNDSRVPLYNTLRSLDLLRYATVIKTIGKAMQIKAYDHCLKTFGSTAQWMAFIDVDEFMVAKTTHGNLPVFLKEYEGYGSIGMNSLVFGSSGHQQKSKLPQLENFTMRAEEAFGPNRHIKNILQPRYAEKALGAHSFAYCDGKFCVNENFERIDGSFSDVSVNKIQLNHYYCRSFEEYEAKISRGYGDTSKKRTVDEFFHHDKEANKVKDTTILELFKD